MGMPAKVREAYERGDYEKLRRMREKAARTRATNLARNKSRKERMRDEELSAQDWYQEKFEREMEERRAQTDPAFLRRDHELPEDDLPF